MSAVAAQNPSQPSTRPMPGLADIVREKAKWCNHITQNWNKSKKFTYLWWEGVGELRSLLARWTGEFKKTIEELGLISYSHGLQVAKCVSVFADLEPAVREHFPPTALLTLSNSGNEAAISFCLALARQGKPISVAEAKAQIAKNSSREESHVRKFSQRIAASHFTVMVHKKADVSDESFSRLVEAIESLVAEFEGGAK